jgi:hypothetical protein
MASALEQLTWDIDALSGVPGHRLRDEQEKVWKKLDEILKTVRGDPDVLQSVSADSIKKVLLFLVAWYKSNKILRNRVVEKVNTLLQCEPWAEVAERHDGLGLLEMAKLDEKVKMRLEGPSAGYVQAVAVEAGLTVDFDSDEKVELKGQFLAGLCGMEEFGWKFPPADGRHADRDRAMDCFNCVTKAVTRLEVRTGRFPSETGIIVETIVAEVHASSWKGILSFLVTMYAEAPGHRKQVQNLVEKLHLFMPSFRAAVEAEPPYFWETAGDAAMAKELQEAEEVEHARRKMRHATLNSLPEAEELEARLCQSICQDDMNVPRLKWMWGDAGLLGLHSIAKLNAARWSSYRPPWILAAELEEWVAGDQLHRSVRPVEVCAEGSGRTRKFSDYKEAVKWLREDGVILDNRTTR